MEMKQFTLFDRIGGTPVIDRLVDLFYMNVLADPKIAPLFPQDMSLVISKQKQFLTQYFGGPPLYTNEHGHPKMTLTFSGYKRTGGRMARLYAKSVGGNNP